MKKTWINVVIVEIREWRVTRELEEICIEELFAQNLFSS